MANNNQTANDKAKEKGAKTVNQKAPMASGFSVPERIWNFLTQEKGVGSIEAAAIMGNIAQESMYNTEAVSFDGAGGIGICQWTNTADSGYRLGRKTDFINYIKAKGKTEKDLGDLELQLDFMWHEIESGKDISYMKTAIANLGANATVDQKIEAATKSFCDGFEKPGKGYEAYENRYKYAKEAYQKQGKGILAAGTYNPGNAPANGHMGQTSAAKHDALVEKRDSERIGHADEYRVRPLDPDKTFCEPIYPDLTTIGKDIPTYAVPKNIPTDEMQLVDYDEAGAGLVHKVSTETILKHANNKDLIAFNVYNQKAADQRKKVFNVASHRNAVKVPSAGKPPNNLDPFPVDHKIVEMETHQPRCKIEEVFACHHSLDVAKKLVILSIGTEKRLVHLENNMATMMRYLHRLASRMNINCVYYGGQIPATYPAKGPNGENNKYCCIRCLKDDRIQEGKQVSLDQCLNCTRYEPLIGQVYDIYNDYAVNLSQILDDNQMSYTTMDEYCKFTRVQERQMPMEKGSMDVANSKTRNTTEIDFDDAWGPGLAMDWSLYPVELQQPHTEPPVEGALASAFSANSGAGMTNAGVTANMLIEARNQIDAGDSNAKQAGSNFAQTETDRIAAELKAGRQNDIRNYYQSKGITSGQDTCLIAALMAVYGGQVGNTVDKLESVKTELKGKGVDNIVLNVMFYSLDTKYLFGEGSDDEPPVRLDKVKKKIDDDHSSTIMPDGAWNNVAQWNWNNIAEPLTINMDDGDTKKLPNQMLNFAKVVYLYKELIGKCSASRFDTADWGFPFTEEQIASAEIGLNHPANGEFNNFRGDHYHNGVDIGVFGGSWSKRHPEGSESKLMRQPVHAARDGIVSWLIPNGDPSGGGGGNCMGIQHDNGYSSCYMHLSGFAVKQGQKVSRGEVIGYTGGSGGSTLIDYDEHLHFEIRPDGQRTGIDPWSVYNGNLSSRPRPFQFRDVNI